MPHIHLEKVQPFAGFTTQSAEPNSNVEIICRGSFLSDDPSFHVYGVQLVKFFLPGSELDLSHVNHLLVILHADQSADTYLNELDEQMRVQVTRQISAGEMTCSP